MVRCSVVNCKIDSLMKIAGLSFHSFPNKPEIRNMWIAATNRPNWAPKMSSRICSQHFDSKLIIKKGKKTLLYPDAVPNKSSSSISQRHMQELASDNNAAARNFQMFSRPESPPLPPVQNGPPRRKGEENRFMRRQKRQHGDQPGFNHAADDAGSSDDDNISEPPPPPQLNLHTAQICRVCLALNVKMFDLRDTELKTMFHFTTGITFEENNGSKLGSLICWECAARLKAASKFRSKALFSETWLKRLINEGEQMQEQYFEAATEASLISPTTLTFSGIVHTVEIEGQNNMTERVQSSDDDEATLSAYDETEIKDELYDEHTEMDLEEDLNDAIKTEIEDDPTCSSFTEEQNRTNILKEYPLNSTSSTEETINSGYNPLLGIDHTSLRSEPTIPLEDYDDQICKHLITTMPIEVHRNFIKTNPNQLSNTSINSILKQMTDIYTKTIPNQMINTCTNSIPNQTSNTCTNSIPNQKSKTCTNSIPNQKSNTCTNSIPNQKSNTCTNSIPNQKSNTCTNSIPNQTSNTCTNSIPNQKSNTCTNSIPNQMSYTSTTKTSPNQMSNTCTNSIPNQMSNTCTNSTPKQMRKKTNIKTLTKSITVRKQNVKLKSLIKRSGVVLSHDHTYFSKGASEDGKVKKRIKRSLRARWYRKKGSSRKVQNSSVAMD